MGVSHELRLLSGGANPALAAEIAEHMQTRLADVELRRFADGEIFVKINENIRGRDVFIVQSTNPPAENLLELLLLIDAARRASAHRIAAVVPYFGYARADRKDQPRVAISSKLVANMLTQAGIDRLITIDLHSHQVQGFFDVPLDHLYASPVFLDYFRAKGLKDVAVVAPMADGLVLVVRAGATPKPLIERALAACDESRLIGLVLNGTGDRDAAYESYAGQAAGE